jgi:hypothetical protein
MIIKVMNDNGFNRKKRTRHERYEFMKHINLADSSKFLAAAALALLLTACGGGGGDGVASGGSGLSLSITDAPVSSEDVSEVWVRFTQVIVKPSDGDTIVIDVTDNQENPYRDIELTSLSSGRSELLLGQEPLPAGNYSWIRLVIDPEYTYVVETQGGTPLVDCSSCDESHLKLNRSFVIEEGGVTAFTIDFDLRQSLTLKMPKTEQPRPDFAYKLRPTLRIEDTELASAFIYGDVTDNRSEPTDCWVYVYTGSEARVEPDDICNTVAIDGVFCAAADRPLLEAIVEDTETPGLKEFQTGYMLPDIYTVSLVCEDLVKTITSDGPYTLGSSIEYGYAVTNSGNISLAGPVTVADDLTTVTCLPVSDVGNLDDSLNPGEEITCTSTYTVIEADVSAGIVTNTATASADGTTSDEDQASADIVAP